MGSYIQNKSEYFPIYELIKHTVNCACSLHIMGPFNMSQVANAEETSGGAGDKGGGREEKRTSVIITAVRHCGKWGPYPLVQCWWRDAGNQDVVSSRWGRVDLGGKAITGNSQSDPPTASTAQGDQCTMGNYTHTYSHISLLCFLPHMSCFLSQIQRSYNHITNICIEPGWWQCENDVSMWKSRL